MIELISKTPVPGWCKTRIADALGAGKATRLQEALLLDSLNVARLKQVPVRIWFGTLTNADYLPLLPAECEIKMIPDTDLNQMIELASKASVKSSYKILIGVDSPHALFQHLSSAIKKIKTSPLVLGPTEDGGVYLIGYQTAHPINFSKIEWGTDQVFKQLAGDKCETLPQEIDVDTYKDLKVFKEILNAHPERAPNCATLLQSWKLE